MKGLYITTYDANNAYSGVCKKITSQVSVFEHYGISMSLVDAGSIKKVSSSTLLNQLSSLFGRNNKPVWEQLFDVSNNLLLKDDYEFIYIRKTLLDSFQVRCLRDIKNNHPNIKIIVEIPTYPYDNEIRLSQKLALRNDKRVRCSLQGVVDRFVTYSKDKEIFGIPTIVIPNGINYQNVPIRKPLEHKGINVIAVALFEAWHGYDRFLDGMIKQKDTVTKYNINFYLAGKGRILASYRDKVEKNGLNKYVHFCGELRGKDLDDLYNIADIALDCMGRHRVGLYYNSSLKGKEYCAHGVPIISGIETELDSVDDFPYYMRVPADDTLIDMNDVVTYFSCCYQNKDINTVVTTIRKKSKSRFDFIYAFKPVVDFVRQ